MPSQIGHSDERSNRGLKKKKKSQPHWYRYASKMTKQWANSGHLPSKPKKYRQWQPWAPCTLSDGQAAPQNQRTISLEVPGGPALGQKDGNKDEDMKGGGGERDAEKPGSGTPEGKLQPTVDASYGISIEKRRKADTLKEVRLEAEFPPQVALLVVLEKGMATHPSILAWRIPMDRGAWQLHSRGSQESDTT